MKINLPKEIVNHMILEETTDLGKCWNHIKKG